MTPTFVLFDELHAQGLTVIMVTHDPNVAHRAQRIVTLTDGNVVSDQLNGHQATHSGRDGAA